MFAGAFCFSLNLLFYYLGGWELGPWILCPQPFSECSWKVYLWTVACSTGMFMQFNW